MTHRRLDSEEDDAEVAVEVEEEEDNAKVIADDEDDAIDEDGMDLEDVDGVGDPEDAKIYKTTPKKRDNRDDHNNKDKSEKELKKNSLG